MSILPNTPPCFLPPPAHQGEPFAHASPGLYGAASQAAWYVDPDTDVGSDHALTDGAASDRPLATLSELMARIGVSLLTSAVTVSLAAGTFTGGGLIAPRISPAGSLAITGTRTVLASYTAGTITAWNAATPVPGKTDVGATDWTTLTYVGKLARITSATRLGSRTVIAKDLTSGEFRDNWSHGTTGAAVLAVTADTFAVYDVTAISGNVVLDASGGSITLTDLDLGASGSVTVLRGSVTFSGCIVRNLVVKQGATVTLIGCRTINVTCEGKCVASGCVHEESSGTMLQIQAGGVYEAAARILCQGAAPVVGSETLGPGALRVAATTGILGICDFATGLTVHPGSSVQDKGAMFCYDDNAAASGFVVKSGGQIVYSTLPVFGGTAPTTEFTIGGTAKLTAAMGSGFVEAANNAMVVPLL
jgi:hypothetical protein